ncbi:antibiotic biosynthesis monooxygenase [Chitinophaga pollutisoli]|uniref:Antibiotic biosynthesis monooxygenase n=1 Tax=Chitinophaga pollutisoli TaxID=3133966 RepID=A0ABZ2YJI2_9BACT
MNARKSLSLPVFTALLALLLLVGNDALAQQGMMVRIAEIEIDTVHLEKYKEILREEAAASVQLEPGVIAIFPMFEKSDPARIKILEIYAGKEAYDYHLKTPHFLKYKTATMHMVKSPRLLDMGTIDPASKPAIFLKLRGNVQ